MEYIGYGIEDEGYGEIHRVEATGAHWKLNNDLSWFEDPNAGGNSGLHHIFVHTPEDEDVIAHIRNTATGEEWHEPLALKSADGHIAALEFPMWGSGNMYDLSLEGHPSDTVKRMHLPGNVHVSFHLYFELAEGVPAPITLRDALLQKAAEEQLIEFNPDAALQKEIFADGVVPNSPEFPLLFDGISYVAQRAEHLQSGEVRVYFAEIDDYSNVQYEVR